MTRCAALIAVVASLAAGQTRDNDPVLKAMQDEMRRVKVLAVLEKPYYTEYQIEDVEAFTASATLGALLGASQNRFRIPQIAVRVGDYSFDNTNHVYSSFYTGVRYDPSQWPLDGRYDVLRHYLWLGTDRAYKTAIEGISRKRASLKNAAQDPEDDLPDFSKAEPVSIVEPVTRLAIDPAAWTRRAKALSAVFRSYPEIMDSSVEANASQGTSYFVNSEGAVQRTPDGLYEVRARAVAQSADGAILRNAIVFAAQEAVAMPSDDEMGRGVAQVASELRALAAAPPGESYSGPMLFEGKAAAQLLAQLLGENLRASRRPIADPGRPAPYTPGEFESKIGSRILPEWIDVVDDPTQRNWRGRELLGYYETDMEGIPPKPVAVVEKGVLKSFLTTREPVKGFSQTNGHARLPGMFGDRSAAIGNLFVHASQAKPMPALKAQLIEMCKRSGKPYGILVRKLDYPSSMSVDELRAAAASMMQSGSGARPVSPPLLVYRVYPDGREELVRGLRFRGLSARTLRDIIAAGDDDFVFDFINNGAPFALLGAGGYVAPTTVVAPSLLFEEVELERPQEDRSKPPLVPAPPID